MPRRIPALTLAAALLAATGGAAIAQQAEEPPTGRLGQVDAVDYIRGLLANDRYDPADRERALNGAPMAGDAHWRSSIFDGRRTRATRGTGLRLPDLPRAEED